LISWLVRTTGMGHLSPRASNVCSGVKSAIFFSSG
jgi:hypothetical protein